MNWKLPLLIWQWHGIPRWKSEILFLIISHRVISCSERNVTLVLMQQPIQLCGPRVHKETILLSRILSRCCLKEFTEQASTESCETVPRFSAVPEEKRSGVLCRFDSELCSAYWMSTSKLTTVGRDLNKNCNLYRWKPMHHFVDFYQICHVPSFFKRP